MPRIAVSEEARHEAREYLVDAARSLRAFERGEEDPEHAWALVVAARQFAVRAAQLLTEVRES